MDPNTNPQQSIYPSNAGSLTYTNMDVRGQVTKALASRQKLYLNEPEKKPSAVLLLLYEKDSEYHMMFTVRTSLVEDHKGEISFPGGAFHHGVDLSLMDTAVRESAEEVGVVPDNVHILGELDDMLTRSNYVISPFVGVLKQPQEFNPSAIEVAEILEVPLTALLSPGTPKYGETHPVTHAGRQVPGVYYSYQGYVVWGATARMLQQFLNLCFPSLTLPTK